MPYKNKQQLREYQKRWIAQRRAKYIAEMGGVCNKCNSSDHLEVDHIDPATKVNSRIWSWSHARIREELAKCQLLCYACHKKKSIDTQSFIIKNDVHSHNRYVHYGCRCLTCKTDHARVNAKYRKKNLGD